LKDNTFSQLQQKAFHIHCSVINFGCGSEIINYKAGLHNAVRKLYERLHQQSHFLTLCLLFVSGLSFMMSMNVFFNSAEIN